VSEDDVLVRKFIIHSDAEAAQLYAFLRQRHELAKFGKVFQVVVAAYAPDRRADQNRKMWVAYLEPIANQARLNRHHAMAEDWHRIIKIMFLPEFCAKGIHKWTYKENGDRELTMSTGDLNEDEMELYLHEIGSYATNDLGVHLPANPRDLKGTQYESENPE
jgi:hypothetical protein